MNRTEHSKQTGTSPKSRTSWLRSIAEITVILPAIFGFLNATFLKPAYAWEIETVMGITVKGGSGEGLSSLVSQLLNILYSLAGASALVMVFWGAYRYISSAGDPKRAQEGKEIIQSAVYGLILILIAFLLAQTLGDFFGNPDAFTKPEV